MFYKNKNKFYLDEEKTKEIQFELLLLNHLIETKHFMFLAMCLAYIRLASKIFGLDIEAVETEEDLDDLGNIYFKVK